MKGYSCIHVHTAQDRDRGDHFKVVGLKDLAWVVRKVDNAIHQSG